MLRTILQKVSLAAVSQSACKNELLLFVLDLWKEGAPSNEAILKLIASIGCKGEEAKEAERNPFLAWLKADKADKNRDFTAKLQLHSSQSSKSFACKVAQKME